MSPTTAPKTVHVKRRRRKGPLEGGRHNKFCAYATGFECHCRCGGKLHGTGILMFPPRG